LLVDYHVHTPYCGHAQGNIIQYIETAIQTGLQEIGFSDHLGRYYLSKVQKRRYWDWGMSERDLARYFSELSDLRDVFEKQIKIKIGLEIDYIEGAEDMLHPLLDQYPLDFCIGSIHCMPRFGWKHISDYSAAASVPIYKEYFRLAQAAIKSGIFNSLAHLDFIWRYIQWPPNSNELVFQDITDTIELATKNKVCVEVNANGYLWSRDNEIHEIQPYEFLLDEIKRCGTDITLGSDAHGPMMVSKSFPEIIKRLHTKGITNVCCFTDGVVSREVLG
jgi:histidinol-phosphatase (PHP family)